MFYRAQRFNRRRFNAQDNFRREPRIKLSIENFNVWKFPQMCVHDTGGPLPDQKTTVSLNDKGSKVAGRRCRAFAEVGQFCDAIFAEGDAEFSDRANPALRIARRADQRAEFHEGLVQVRSNFGYCGADVRRL